MADIERNEVESIRDKIKQCPFCAEDIKKEAIKCKHCGAVIPNERMIEAEEAMTKNEEVAEQREINNYFRAKLNISYLSLIIGFLFGMFLVVSNIEHVMFVPKGEIGPEFEMNFAKLLKLSPYIVSIFFGYFLWSLYWGIQIVSRPIKNYCSGVVLFSSHGVIDLLGRKLMLILGINFLLIPGIGFIVGFFGGGIFMHIKYILATRKIEG